jgi:hypothetical protein
MHNRFIAVIPKMWVFCIEIGLARALEPGLHNAEAEPTNFAVAFVSLF